MILGKNPTLVNVRYVRPDNRRQYKECFQVVYNDDDGEPRFSEEPAEADFYVVKPEFRDYTYNKPQIEISKCNKVTVPISKVRYKIAEEAGEWGKQIVNLAGQQRNMRILDQVFKWPYAFGADFAPEFYFMRRWYNKYTLNMSHLSTAFMDIEVDQMDYTVNMDNVEVSAFAPVNVITVILEDTKEAWTFIKRPYVPPQSGYTEDQYNRRYDMYKMQLNDHEYLMNHLPEYYNKLHDEFDGTYGYINYHIKEYDQEIELIADAFRLINTRKPNFCFIWNMRFDIPYLISRIQNLGYDPSSIICHPDINYPMCQFRKDDRTFLIEKQYDQFLCSSFTTYVCQMRLYSSARKAQHKLRSVKLNAIADRELKDKKVDYEDEGNIVTFAYNDWLKFIRYNIKDCLLQLGIMRKTNDVTSFWMRSQSNMTPYNKIYRETQLLRNVREIYFEKEGFVQSNNIRVIKDLKSDSDRAFYGDESPDSTDEEGSFKGAINADPKWNAYNGEPIMGVPSNNIQSSCVDFDMSSFYPSIKISTNMDPDTLIFKASLNPEELQSGEFNNRSLNQTYTETDKNGKVRGVDVTGEAVNTFISGNILTFGYNWLNLPAIGTLKERVIEYIKNK